MSKHTPGPWRIGRSGKDYPYQIEAMDGRGITSWRGISRPASAEGEANANLIAAAPELLEALEQAVTSMQDSGYPNSHVAVRAARQAISKAKGESA